MNKLISIVGASGVGKTSLVQALGKTGKFAVAFEQHTERPFQALFKADAHYALANQVDYLLLRAEQERMLRAASLPGLMDGGLDLDFHGFTRLFHLRGALTDPEYDLCRRVYEFIRQTLPPPELFVRLCADQVIVERRLARRNRINIAKAEDTALFDSLLDEWLATVPANQILELDVSGENLEYPRATQAILTHLSRA